jgi:hypothetical protein
VGAPPKLTDPLPDPATSRCLLAELLDISPLNIGIQSEVARLRHQHASKLSSRHERAAAGTHCQVGHCQQVISTWMSRLLFGKISAVDGVGAWHSIGQHATNISAEVAPLSGVLVLLCCRHAVGLDRSLPPSPIFRRCRQHSSSVAWQHRHHWLICRASRKGDEVGFEPAVPDAAQQPSSLASVSASGDFSDNGAQAGEDAAQLIGEDVVEVRSWALLGLCACH